MDKDTPEQAAQRDIEASPATGEEDNMTAGVTAVTPARAAIPLRDAAFFARAKEAQRLEKRAARLSVAWSLGLVGTELALFLLVGGRYCKLAYMLLAFLLFIPLALPGGRLQARADAAKLALGLDTRHTVSAQLSALQEEEHR